MKHCKNLFLVLTLAVAALMPQLSSAQEKKAVAPDNTTHQQCKGFWCAP